MAESRFTPGPWRQFEDDVIVAGEAQLGYGAHLAFPDNPVGLDGPFSREQIRANVRLMAAAPEMYDALVAICKHIEESLQKDIFTTGLGAAHRAARAALDKATDQHSSEQK